jgi:alpha-glucuronidase
VQQVQQFQKVWDQAERYVDPGRFGRVQHKLRDQSLNATEWKDACLLYFQQFSQRPIPYDLERPVNNLEDLIEKDERTIRAYE